MGEEHLGDDRPDELAEVASATRASSIVNMPTNRPPLTIGRRRIACELGSTEVFDLTRVDAALLLEEAVVSCRDRGVLRWRVDS